MKELLEFIVRSIASNPEEVKVTESIEDNGNKVLLQLEVSPSDKGKVIGRQGRVAQSIRTLLRVASIKNGTRAVLEIL
ncbi:MAG: hypothetical protein DK302_001667 [Chloroflexi bacterium]|jgi:predicted RNA-binding protein YlqC (UPF0109 family)|nr:MAG: hypothetical protein DK302_001667 [Chloroflexota bacterium]|tara:strand:+ start:308 stop:541 length:234 start_codon:yes stop_codon:yes gene_type:complete